MPSNKLQFPPRSFSKLNPLAAAVTLGLASLSGNLAAQDAAIEEVVVTGSYIRQTEGFGNASPVTSFSAEDIEAEGTINMAQVVQNLTFNNGTGVTNSIQGTTNQIANFNLRGLGPRATLTLVDGKRVVESNVQQLLPTMAMQRMDIVTDGAATIYGTDAVAGVVNLVPYKSYDGFKIEMYEEGDSRGDYRQVETGFLGGKTIGDIDIVVAGSYRDGGTLSWDDRPEYIRAGLTHNGGSNPGSFIVPVRDANGDLTYNASGAPVTTQRTDPSCGKDASADQVTFANNPWGNPLGSRCFLSFGDTRDFIEAMDTANFFTNMTWEVSDDLSFNAQFMYNRQLVRGRENPGNPGFREDDLPTVRGELPGNTFRAVAPGGAALYAVPLRDATGNIVNDGYGQPLPFRDGSGLVALAQNRFASIDTDPLGGVPFNEDVRLTQWLPFGKNGIPNTLPQRMQQDGGLNMELDDKRTYRMSLGADFTVPFIEGWEGTAFYTYSETQALDVGIQDFSFSAVEQGLNCDVVNDVGSCFNPFGAVDPRFRNSQQVADSVYTQYRADNRDYLHTFDVILNGEVPISYELPGGPIAMAVGYQRREEEDSNTPPLGDILGDQLIGNQQLPNNVSRYSDSYFAEFNFPVLDNLAISASVRDESFSTGQGELIDKYGISYQPTDWLNLRATTGKAFIVPTLPQLNSPEACGLSNFDDPFTPSQGFITSCAIGNPNLSPETSESTSIGFDITLFEDLTWSVSWSETDFADRIVSTTTQDIARSDFRDFQAWSGFTPTDAQPEPTEAELQAWVSSGLADPRIVRNALLQPVRLLQSDSNASTMLVKAWDTTLAYGFGLQDIGLGDWGRVNMVLNATYVDTYSFQLQSDSPLLEAVGNQNNDYGAVPPMPELQANLRVSWVRGQHSFSATGRYVDEVNFDANEFSFQQFFPGNEWRSTDVLRAWSQMDMFYGYSDLEALGGSFNFTVGARNVFDRMPQRTGMIAGVEAVMQNPLGRVIYARVNYNF
ncbi:MAG: TonB-dependent receptor [Gammaproteobacteria bacterium]|nr:TonB-dependent receptor [Gammaproteobacteria bacterium]